jgi:hypothetical protein
VTNLIYSLLNIVIKYSTDRNGKELITIKQCLVSHHNENMHEFKSGNKHNYNLYVLIRPFSTSTAVSYSSEGILSLTFTALDDMKIMRDETISAAKLQAGIKILLLLTFQVLTLECMKMTWP